MDELKLVRRLAEHVSEATQTYMAGHADFSAILKDRTRDVTRKIDMVAEETLDAALLREGIACRVISEEIGERIVPAGSTPHYTLLCDPVDGSNNLAAGVPYYCVSLALSRKPAEAAFGDLEAAAVASPVVGTFSAARGRGAFWNTDRILTRFTGRKPAYAIYAYGAGTIPAWLVRLQESDCTVRTMGSIALDICMVARGSFSAVIDTRAKVSGYDIMGAALVLAEAGGETTTLDGRGIEAMPLEASQLSIVATGSKSARDAILRVNEGLTMDGG